MDALQFSVGVQLDAKPRTVKIALINIRTGVLQTQVQLAAHDPSSDVAAAEPQ